MRPEILQGALTPAQRAAGFYLEEPDDHFLFLKRGTAIIARFVAVSATVEAIRAEADKKEYLAKSMNLLKESIEKAVNDQNKIKEVSNGNASQ